MSHVIHRLKQFLPWAIAAAIFVYLFRHYPPSQVLVALKYVKLLPFLSFALAYFLLIFAVDAWVTKRAISQFSHSVGLRNVVIARGVTYLIMVVNYPAAQAAFAYYLKRQHQVPILECLGIFLFLIIVDLLWICLLAFAGSFFQEVTFGPVDMGHLVRVITMTTFGVFFLWHAFWKRWPAWLWRGTLVTRIANLLRQRKIFHVFEQTRLVDYFRFAVMRIPIHFSIIISIYVVAQTFSTHIPFVHILGNLPIVFLIGTLPIAPGGLGTVNVAMVELLSPHMESPIFDTGTITPKQMMFALTLLWMAANYAFKALAGILLLSRVSKDLFRPTPDLPLEEAEERAVHLGGNL